ncbi:hypothetical protein [Streptomyces sp. NBC_01477]|nr:hypothetical protein [Streptomyces sp. NBC_01477]
MTAYVPASVLFEACWKVTRATVLSVPAQNCEPGDRRARSICWV